MSQPSQYLSVQEFLSAPTGLDIRNTPAPGATGPAGVSAVQWYEELTNVLLRASALADNYCRMIVGASVNTEEVHSGDRNCGINRDGELWVMPRNLPIISVSSLQYGYPALGGTVWQAVTASDLYVTGPRKNVVRWPGAIWRRQFMDLRVQYTYTNGYANSFLSATAPLGSTSLALKDLTGFLGGDTPTIYDGGNTEQVTVASTFVPATGAGNLPLVGQTAYTHTIVPRVTLAAPNQPQDISVSNLPPDFKQAVILIAKFLIQQRGASSLVMARVGIEPRITPGEEADEIPAEAQLTLDLYKAIV